MIIDLFFINKIIVLLIDIVAISLGGWVYFSNPKQKLNKVFLGMVFFMMLWVNFAYLARAVGESNPYLVFLFLKIAWVATPLFFILLYILALYILDEDFKFKATNLIIISLAIISSFAVGFTDHIVKGVKFMGVFLIRLVYGDWMLPFLIVISLFISVTLLALFKKYYSSSKKDKEKIKYYLLGIIIFYIANIIFNIFLPIVFDITRFYFLGDYSTIILLGLIAYAIVKQELFDIKVVLTALFLGLMAIIFLLEIFVPFSYSYIFKPVAFLIFIVLSRALIKHDIEEAERLKKTEKLAQDLENANKYLKDLMELKTNFIHIVSHQLRTPLTAVRGYLTMWDEGEFDSCSPRKMTEIKKRIITSADRLNNIVNGMVVAMETEGDIELKFQLIDVEEILKEAIGILKINYDKKDLYLRYKKEGGVLPKIESDSKYLSNVFMNLIDNAEKYTKKGGLSIKIFREGNNVKLIFTDTGVGISKEDREKLFKKFSRGTNSSYINPNGSGLGLFIVKQIIDKHHGKIEVSSEGEGKGIIFIITLPIKQPISAGAAKLSLSGDVQSKKNNSQRDIKLQEVQSYLINKKKK